MSWTHAPLWSEKDKLTRVEVYLTPNRTWSEAALAEQQNGPEPTSSDQQPKPSLLGLSLRACNPVNALESVYHVLDVLEGSPAEVSCIRGEKTTLSSIVKT